MSRKLQVGDRVVLIVTDLTTTDGNSKFTVGDIGTVTKVLKLGITEVSWDRPGLGDSRWDNADQLRPNCWAVATKGLALSDEQAETFHPLNWKIRYMYERQPYRQKQLGANS